MLASISITLTISFFLLRHKKLVRQAQLKKDQVEKERASQPPPPKSLPIAASMSKRVPDKSTGPPPPAHEIRAAVDQPAQVQKATPEMTPAVGFTAFHSEDQEDAFAGELRDRLTRLSQQGPLPPNRLYIPPSPPSPISASTGSVLQAKQVKFSTIRAVENAPVRLSEEEEEEEDGDERFTVSRTVRRSASKREKKGGVKIGVRTWIESDSSR